MNAGPSRGAPGFAAGERAPDFLLPNPEGQFGRFYDRFTGDLVALFFCPSGSEPSALRELMDFAAEGEAFAALGARIVAVTRDSPDANAALKAERGIDYTLFSDPTGAITKGYGADAPASATPTVLPWAETTAGRTRGCTTYLLDRNQRVLAVLRGGQGHAARALAYLRSEVPAPTAGRVVTAQAPVLLLPNVADAALCAHAIEAWQADHEEGTVRQRAVAGAAEGAVQTKAVNYGVKKRLDHRPDEALNQALTDQVIGRIGPELLKAFQFRVVALERFCIAAYEAGRGDYFKPHRDNTTQQTQNRRFAVTLNLNDDYEGGGVKFPEFGDDVYRTPAGGALVFSCSLMHEALPVTAGTRFAALSFMFGPGDVPDPAAGRPGGEG